MKDLTLQLRKFPTHNRRTYREEFGDEAPPFNPAWKWVKRWADPTADVSRPQAAYKVRFPTIGVDGLPKFKELLITNEIAANYNLPGLTGYPAWKPTKTAAYYAMRDDGERVSDLSRWRLSTRASAEELKKELEEAAGLNKRFKIEEEQHDPPVFVWYPPTETRRLWLLRNQFGKPMTFNVGEFLRVRHLNGVNAPGFWTVDTPNGSVKICWHSEVPMEPTGEDYPELPCPCRELNPEEELMVAKADNKLLPEGSLYIHVGGGLDTIPLMRKQ